MSPSCVPVHEEYSRIHHLRGAKNGSRRWRKLIKMLVRESKSIYGSKPLTFQYDAVSYSQNFDDGCHSEEHGRCPQAFREFRWHLFECPRALCSSVYLLRSSLRPLCTVANTRTYLHASGSLSRITYGIMDYMQIFETSPQQVFTFPDMDPNVPQPDSGRILKTLFAAMLVHLLSRARGSLKCMWGVR
ncbi:hypothetical protein F0562_003121 [Nyssa sinensis]|uniref:Uncharacterized protein n=1 Tax=Nyssa sinensis TaxID=561372 RepID=A0A5J5BV21_9ASTE|nr:hypothetical protein F0562_003121 [Nyssa sinensis]